MAEHYGVKPKMFTKEWWPYYWLYYKWHTIAVVFVLILAVIGISNCVSKEKYDLAITYLGRTYYDEANWYEAVAELAKDIDDADGNGKEHISFTSLITNEKKEYAQQNYATYVKHDTSLGDEFSYIYIYDENELTENSRNDFVSENYFEAIDWLNGEVGDDMLVYNGDKAYAVSLKNSTVLNNAGIDSENLYILVKYDEDLPDANKTAHNNAIKVANKLIK